ncbi:MAG: 30S ribosomal protein THX [Ferruginibacter sp.]
MGRGDIKTKKGKIFAGSFGKSRPAKSKATVAVKAKAATAAPAAPAKKAAAKKEK